MASHTTLIRVSDLRRDERRYLGVLRRAEKLRIMREGLPSTSSPALPILYFQLRQAIHQSTDFQLVHPAAYLESLRSIVALARKNHPLADTALIEKAFALAWKAHADQWRKSREPYIDHPLAVAKIVAEWGLGAEEVAGALLHDVVEDTSKSMEVITVKRLAAEFNERIAFIVDGVSELGKEQGYAGAIPSPVDMHKKFMHYGSQDLAIVPDKLADRLHNMRTLSYMSLDSARRKAQETLNVYTRIADIAGMWPVKRELEDLAYAVLEPENYERIKGARDAIERSTRQLIEEVGRALLARFIEAGIAVEIDIEIRNAYELVERMGKREIKFEDLKASDIWRINVTIPDRGAEAACYAALGALHSLYPPVREEFEDAIGRPLPNGHRHLHTYVEVPKFGRVLVQIRDRAMYDRYQRGIIVDSQTDPQWHKKSHGWLDALMGNLETDAALSTEEVYEIIKAATSPMTVYTTKGEARILPMGSTVLDFARTIHSQVFLCASAAFINGRPAPLNQRLKMGDMVNVVKAINDQGGDLPQARLEWNAWVNTHKARQALHAFLKSRPQLHIGRSALAYLGERTKDYHLPAFKLLKTKAFRSFLQRKGFANTRDFLLKVGVGEVKVRTLLKGFMAELNAAVAAASVKEPHPIMFKALDRVGLLKDVLSPIEQCRINNRMGTFYRTEESGGRISVVLIEVELTPGDAGEVQKLQVQTIVKNTAGVTEVSTPDAEEIKHLLRDLAQIQPAWLIRVWERILGRRT